MNSARSPLSPLTTASKSGMLGGTPAEMRRASTAAFASPLQTASLATASHWLSDTIADTTCCLIHDIPSEIASQTSLTNSTNASKTSNGLQLSSGGWEQINVLFGVYWPMRVEYVPWFGVSMTRTQRT